MATAAYDPVQAVACLDWLAHLPWGHSLAQPYSAGPCEGALVGQVADGGACTTLDVDLDLSECARSSRCDTSRTCPGVCRPNTRVGQPCDSSTPCERGTYCGALHAGDPRTCLAIGGPQQSCDPTYSTTLRPAGAPPPMVGSADPCVEGYHCDLTQSVCVAEAVDDPCKRGETFCPNGVCATEPGGADSGSGATPVRYVCRPVSGDGGACAQLGTSSQPVPYCPRGSVCASNFSCVAQLEPGSTCDPSAQTTNPCADGFGCGTSNTCESLPPSASFTCTHDLPCGHPGERCCYRPTCTSIFTCGDGATCDPAQTCVAS